MSSDRTLSAGGETAGATGPLVPAEQIVLPMQPTTLAAVQEMLDRQRDLFLRQTRGMLVEAVNQVVAEHGTHLADQLQTSLLQTLKEVQQQQMGPFFEKTRETILATFKGVTQQDVQPLLDRLRETLLKVANELQQQQLDPLSVRTREFLLKTADELRDKYAAPLAGQVKEVLLATVAKVGEQYAPSLLAVANQMRADLIASLKTILTEPVEKFVQEQLTEYTNWTGRRILAFVLAVVLFSVAIVLVVLGVVQALGALGVPNWCALLVVGLAVILFGLLFYLRWLKLGKQKGGA